MIEKHIKFELIQATIKDYPIIQNMARFYVYDMSRFCGLTYSNWKCPEDGLYVCDDFKKYFEDSDRKAFLIKVANELAGFVLLNKHCVIESVDWNMGEFFILAQFQGTGLATSVALKVLNKFPGKWSIGAIPENTKAVKFWRKIIAEISGGNYREIPKTGEELKTEDYPDPYPMIMMLFDTNNSKAQQEVKTRLAIINDIPNMVALSYEKRRNYEKFQPQFWRYAENAEDIQKRTSYS
jgi:predicted acetyltransferase